VLHIVGDIPFDMSEKNVRRAGLDYWQYVTIYRHINWDEYITKNQEYVHWYFSSFGKSLYTNVTYSEKSALVFGSETKGLDRDLLQKNENFTVTIPIITTEVRSLNLSNAVSIGIYECWRQLSLGSNFTPRTR
jgi:tRNA (cytidine/uridine-2'-O-)-methyltransferase